MHRTTVEERLILLALTGSQAYGTAIATSDCDYKGVFIAPKDYYLGATDQTPAMCPVRVQSSFPVAGCHSLIVLS